MFGPSEITTSKSRFENRISKFERAYKRFPKTRHAYWWFIHNVISHPLIGVFPCVYTFAFHDYTSSRINNPWLFKQTDPDLIKLKENFSLKALIQKIRYK